MCQIVITEKSIPAHIAGWLDSPDVASKHVVVLGDRKDPVVRKCLKMAREKGVAIEASRTRRH